MAGDLDELNQALFDDSDDGLLIADGQGLIATVNRRAIELSGYCSDEIAGLTLSYLFVRVAPDGSAEPFVPLDAGALNGGDDQGPAVNRECGIRRRDGTILPVQIAARLLTGSRRLVRFRDLSARRLTEDGEWTFRSLVESAQDVIFISDVTGRFVYVNSAAAATLGMTQDAVIGKSVDELFPPSVAARYRAGVEDVVRTGQTLHTEDRLELAGCTMWFNSIVQPVRDRKGRITAAQGFIRNVTGLKDAEASMRRNEERLRQAVRVTHIGIFDHDHRSGALYWSPETREIYGWEPDEPVGFDPPSEASTSTWQMVHPDDRERVARALEKAHSSPDGRFDIDYRIRRRDGGVRWLTTRSQTFFEGEGNTRQPVRTIGAVRDVTDIKEAEQALRLNEERLLQITRLAKIGIFDHDHRTGSVYWSREARDIYGLDPKGPVFFEHRPEVQQPGWLELLHPDDRARALQAVRAAHESEHGVFELEHRIVRPDGQTRWVNARSQTFFEGEGETRRPVRTIGAVRDVTAFKEAEQAIRGNEERLRQVARVARIGIFDHDHRTGSVYWSPEMRKIHEWGAEERVQFERGPQGGRIPADTIFPEDREQVLAAIRRAHGSDDGLFDMEYRLTVPDGIRWVSAQSQTFFEGEGADRRAVRTIGATVDITDRKTAEAERERLHAQLLQAQKMETVGRLAGGVAHDFNNMLNVIGGYAELALKEIDSASPLYTPLLEIQNASRRSADLTRQLLAFARKQPVKPKVIDVNRLIDGSLNMLRRLIGEDIQLEWLPGDLWLVKIDPAQVDQVLMNLVVNARDAIAGHGHITVRTRNVTIDDRHQIPWIVAGDYAALEVADDGPGMDEETKAHIFEPFFSTKGEGRGTGLGLATVYGIVKQNNGVITVESAPGHGTTLSVLLPRVTDATVEIGELPEGRVQSGTETLLLVEDEPMVLRLTGRLLETLGYTVLSASGPGEAIRLAQQQGGRIDLLVTDMVMPEASGRVLADQLRAIYPGLKCLFVSGYFPESGRLNVDGEGDHILQKPFSKRALAAKVREALEATA